VPDTIHLAQLELSARIGVPEAERAAPQRLTASLTLEPAGGLRDLADDLARTVDYFVVARQIQTLAASRPRRLLETLAEEIAGNLLEHFPLAAVEVELRKYILPDTEYVAVRLRRTR
jgi:dihydroneopterin aldolase